MAVASIQEFTSGKRTATGRDEETAKVAMATLACLLYIYRQAVDAPS